MSLVLENISLKVGAETHIYPSDINLETGMNVVIGPTLSGKTTLLRLIAGLDKPSSGRLLLNGVDITSVPVQQRSVAIVYQQYINYPNMTVFDNIASPLRIAKMSKADIARKVESVAELLRIKEYLTRRPDELSGGQQQRTALARALVKGAGIVLLDEPLVNLDYKLREELRSEMRKLFSQQKDTIALYATTEPLEASLLGQNIIVLDEGRVIQSGSRDEVMNRPATLRAAEILSDPRVNTINGLVEKANITFEGSVSFNAEKKLADLSDGSYCFVLRAHHIGLVPQSASAVQIRAVVEMTEVSGSETFIHVTFAGVSWTVQQDGVHSHEINSAVDLYFEPTDLMVFPAATNRREA